MVEVVESKQKKITFSYLFQNLNGNRKYATLSLVVKVRMHVSYFLLRTVELCTHEGGPCL